MYSEVLASRVLAQTYNRSLQPSTPHRSNSELNDSCYFDCNNIPNSGTAQTLRRYEISPIFIDFLKAFDSIHRERMFMILQA